MPELEPGPGQQFDPRVFSPGEDPNPGPTPQELFREHLRKAREERIDAESGGPR
jgi:hypothetical protein